LSLEELCALDRYLEPFGEGLAYNPFFERASVLQAIADARKPVTFLLGSKPTPDLERLSLDHWDVNALAEVQRGVNNFAPGVLFDIRDVLLHDDLAAARQSVQGGAWASLVRDDGPSLVCLGSGRACHAAELLLARMFGTTPFHHAAATKPALPFHFTWPEGLDHLFPSAFRYTADELEGLDREAARAVRKEQASALESGGRVHLDRLKLKQKGESYGVCVAQRRPRGQIWLVLAGVTGPATYAAARLVDRMAFRLNAPPGESSPVFWAPVRARVQPDLDRVGRFLKVEEQELLSGPFAWGA
jgi:hypothetical protein